MSVYVLIISLALSGQIVDGDRYGLSSGEPASAGGPPPVNNTSPNTSPNSSSGSNNSGNRISPPPPFAPEMRTTPATSAEDYGYGAPASRPSSPPVAARINEADPNTKPSAMMRAMLTAPPGSRLTGQPVRLAEVLSGALARQDQSQRVDAYWDLCSSVADYYLGVREQDELQRLRSSVANISPVWQQAESELGVRIGTSQRAAVASQYRLSSLMGGADASSLPLPADLPHCGDYYARYDQVFAGRQSPEAQQLSDLLPMRYQELSDAALAVTRAEEFLGAIAAQRGGGDGTGTLKALELLALRRRAFVQIARDYNRRIARYTELASPGQIDAGRLIGMLIMREGAANTATRPAALAPPPNRQSHVPAENTADDPAQTFAEGWESTNSAAAPPRDDAVQPVSAESTPSKPRREHSLLVPSE
ncbi:MAG: hypothetical protein WD971_03865 [Pirellulales bacterium]